MKEIVIISGKGGTGKTTVTAAFASLAERKVMADCDVDAADLHLILEPEIKSQNDFSGGKRAEIRPDDCIECGKCIEVCHFDAIDQDFVIDPIACEGCGVCAWFCPAEAIDFEEAVNGEWYISDTRFGPLVHARLGIAEENSGKLVTLVRREAKALAEAQKMDYIIVDGAPGVGCPVISSITGANVVLIVTEPTLSGLHDLKRVASLASGHFDIPTYICINKHDINPEMTKQIEAFCVEESLVLAGKIPYDAVVTDAMVHARTVIEHGNGHVADAIRNIWQRIIEE